MWNSHADWLPIGFSTNPWSNLCNLKTFCSSAFSRLELVPIGPHVFYQLALIIGPHLLIEQENHLPSVNLWRREWHWHFFPFHQNLTFFIFHTCRNVKEALRRFEMSLSLLYPFYLENLLLNYVFRFENNEMCCLYFGFATKNADLTDMRGLYLFCALSVSCFYSKETKNFLNSNVSEV